MLLPEALGENPFLPLPAFGGFLHSLLSLAHGHITPTSASIFISPHPLLVCVFSSDVKTLLIGFRAHPDNPGWCQVPLLTYLCKDPFSKYGHVNRFQVFECWPILSGGHHTTHVRVWMKQIVADRWSTAISTLGFLCFLPFFFPYLYLPEIFHLIIFKNHVIDWAPTMCQSWERWLKRRWTSYSQDIGDCGETDSKDIMSNNVRKGKT